MKRSTRLSSPQRLALTPLFLAIALAAGDAMAPHELFADELPQGGQVISGQGAINQSGSTLQIDTSTPRTGINWQKFSIGPDNKVHIQQPDGTSVTLNRVIGSDPSKIMGVLTSNGQVLLLNPNGIWFGPNSRVSTSALLASAGVITDEQAREFANGGKLDIQLKGLVRNDGKISVFDNGTVALLGAQVENAGVIQARKGQVNLATGPKATLDFHGDGLISLAVDGSPAEANSVDPSLKGGVSNSGQIEVGEGVVAMSAQRAAKHLDSVISVGGAVIADSVSNQGGTIVLGNAEQTQVSGNLSAKGRDGGQISVLGDRVTLASGAQVDVSGSSGNGGTALIGGSFQGKGLEQAAQATRVEKGAQLKADGAREGGKVVVWSSGSTEFAGKASAKGGIKGGVVETSGKRLSVTRDAAVDASGGAQSGLWLLDPDRIDIVEVPTGDNVSNAVIANSLANNDVRIEARERINVNAPIVAPVVGSGKTLALIASGTVGSVTDYDSRGSGTALDKAKRNDSGSVHINAPILLKDGNLYVAATGDVRLNDLSTPADSGAAAYGKRAIIDVGNGTIWIKTANTASVIQDANTALIGSKVAVQGASVLLDSSLNHAGILAGQASNGVFHFNQTNASGATTTGTVVAPYSGESMSGVSAQQIKYVGYQDVTASPASGVDSPVNVTLEQGGQRFDYLVFEAAGFVDRNGQPIDPNILMNYLDSSDYLVNGLSFTDSHGDHWKLMPDTGKTSLTRVEKNGVEVGDLPVGFALDAYKGVVMVAKDPRNGTDAGWGVDDYAIGGAMNQGEIQHNSQDGTSEQLLVALGDKVTRVDGVLAWLMNDQAWAQPKDGKAPSGPLLERARVHFLETQDASADAVKLNANQAKLAVQIDDASRQYGDANPTFSHGPLVLANPADSNTQAVQALDQYVGEQLGDPRFALGLTPQTNATQRSDVGRYAISGTASTGDFVNQRYQTQVRDGVLSITPAPLTVTARDQSKVYGDSDPHLGYDMSGQKFDETPDQLLNGGALARAGAGTRAGENVGQYQIGQGELRSTSGNYSLTFKDGVLTITPAPLVIRADDKTKVQGQADPALTHSVEGLKYNDSVAVGLKRDPGEAVGPYAIRQNGIDAGANYQVTFYDGTLTITGPMVPPDVPVDVPGDVPGDVPAPANLPDPSDSAAPPTPPQPRAEGVAISAQAPGSERCTALESPSAVVANYSVTPAVARTYDVQLVCKPRAYGDKQDRLPDVSDVLTYANGLLKDGKFQIPDWNRSVIPRHLEQPQKGGK
ncbi:MBG domain-containing protein [Pseudomonas sp. JUb96]|uniref:MBG domain-containing protein n=1 Tax=Pseudomonas sp. JUb96 TaxID=2940539 RepID=UPI002225DEEC|nr:MBG domain-containing protein [Pseudomonas sp. JUb96]MCW2271628.1 filamentous hemagglutinin family protein [Pseudomonas sp. JUb96]